MVRWHERTVEKPRVLIYTAPGAASHYMRELELGLEEEGIPSELKQWAGENASVLAYEAAMASPLEAGVGIGTNGIAVHYRRLPREAPLFFVPGGELNQVEVRRLGVNAARLVKGIPFLEEQQGTVTSDLREWAIAIATAMVKVLDELAAQEGGAGHE